MSSTALEELKHELRILSDLEGILALLQWDLETGMPSAGAPARARQSALLAQLVHERRASAHLATLLKRLSPLEDRDDLEGALVRRARWLQERAARVPIELVRAMREQQAATYVVWAAARPANDFAAVRPFLEQSVELSRRYSACFPESEHVLDPLIEDSDPGTTTAEVRALLEEVGARVRPLFSAILSRPVADRAPLGLRVGAERQRAFIRRVIEAMGYDFSRGRQDQAPHPFMARIGVDDIRVTSRIREHEPAEGLFSSVHEAGHALYELQIERDLDGGPLGQGISTGVHESQSLLWENMIARGRAFWEYWFEPMKEAYGDAFRDVTLDGWHRAINDVRPRLIRAGADEVTYPLQVRLRFSLECALLEGALAVQDLPEAWNARMQEELGVSPPDDRDGVLQDVHWYGLTLGGRFQGYVLGSLMAAQFLEAARSALPTLDDAIRSGDLGTLRAWLADNVHRPGASVLPASLLKRATGEPLRVEPFVRYLWGKYGELYGLSLPSLSVSG